MEDFRIIAIRPLENCSKEISKSLENGILYVLYDNFRYTMDKAGEVISIEYPPNGLNIYSSPNGPNINISAIVGENGSGKSTLLELIYLLSLCLSEKQKKIKKELTEIGRKNNIIGGYVSNAIFSLELELFYSTPIKEQDKLIRNEIRSIRRSKGITKHFVFNPKKKPLVDKFDLSQFCYSVALNYSLYGLNEIYSPWLKPLFHKNDGYQAPLVINPYRANGKIDINIENELSNYRFILNIIENQGKSFNLIGEKYVDEFDLELDTKSLYFIYWENKKININNSYKSFEKKSKKSIYILVNQIIRKLNESSINNKTNRKIAEVSELKIKELNKIRKLGIRGIENKIINEIEVIESNNPILKDYLEFLFFEYILKKIFKLYLLKFEKPLIFKNNKSRLSQDFYIQLEDFTESELLVDRICNDNSHITLKLRQMMFLKDSKFFKGNKLSYTRVTKNEDYGQKIKDFKLKTTLNLNDLNDYSMEVSHNGAVDLELVPGGIFKPTIKYFIKGYESLLSASLSSGELQFLYTLHTVLYHLRNLNSVQSSSRPPIIKYKNVNLIFDEIEICFHPNFQRIFIYELIKNINLLKIPSIKNVNIIFSTHSPFILSDIPLNNILLLKEGFPQKKDFPQSFGANIYDLLANTFFMDESFIGEFARQTIIKLYDELFEIIEKNEVISMKDYKSLKTRIDMVGDVILRTRLIDLLNEIAIKTSELEVQLKEAEKVVEILKKKLNG